ncbi:hypothetical protein IFM89_029697 [Coptis chinensis]|uniref:ACB domain-containing protein n=1 Tax=Coptis chinensis TaxID=261450 RepID=A0A835IH40_9MAGN|nr:hypothetical protein IFM89_029697 [Coptis chinensis]
MSPEEAIQMYIKLVCELYPSWAAGSPASRKDGDGDASSSASNGMMGPVFSSLVYEEDSNNTEVKLEALLESAREGEIDKLNKFIDTGVSVNLKDPIINSSYNISDPNSLLAIADSEGRTALHWAVDLSKTADVNAKDDEGQTPQRYAAMCDREGVAEFLVKQNADRDVKDNDGKSPCDLCASNSSWMQL